MSSSDSLELRSNVRLTINGAPNIPKDVYLNYSSQEHVYEHELDTQLSRWS